MLLFSVVIVRFVINEQQPTKTNLSTVSGSLINNWVKAVMQGKVFDRIHDQPTTETMNTVDLQMSKVCDAIPTTAWGGKHCCLTLVLTDAPY